MSFLDGVQNVVGASEEYCKSVIERFEPSEEAKNNYQLSLDGKFAAYTTTAEK